MGALAKVWRTQISTPVEGVGVTQVPLFRLQGVKMGPKQVQTQVRTSGNTAW